MPYMPRINELIRQIGALHDDVRLLRGQLTDTPDGDTNELTRVIQGEFAWTFERGTKEEQKATLAKYSDDHGDTQHIPIKRRYV